MNVFQTLYHFIKNNHEWLYKQLGVSESENDSVPNRVICSNKSLLHTMFHIGYRPFDQVKIFHTHIFIGDGYIIEHFLAFNGRLEARLVEFDTSSNGTDCGTGLVANIAQMGIL